MISITPRVPNISFGQDFPVRWNGGDAAASHVFNALSWLFPSGERFFIDVVRAVAAELSSPLVTSFNHELQAFVVQEAIHSRQHQLYNDSMHRRGFRSVVAKTITRLQQQAHSMHVLSRLAIVCAYEHYTTILGDYLLRRPQLLQQAEPWLALLWQWHAVEELEHKAVCFELYHRAGGGYWRRNLLFLLVSLNFSLLFCRQYWHMLWKDGALRRGQLRHTLWRSMQLAWGREGFGWSLLRHGLAYWHPRYHPERFDSQQLIQQWLASHADSYRPWHHGTAKQPDC